VTKDRRNCLCGWISANADRQQHADTRDTAVFDILSRLRSCNVPVSRSRKQAKVLNEVLGSSGRKVERFPVSEKHWIGITAPLLNSHNSRNSPSGLYLLREERIRRAHSLQCHFLKWRNLPSRSFISAEPVDRASAVQAGQSPYDHSALLRRNGKVRKLTFLSGGSTNTISDTFLFTHVQPRV
jgi:hypothetical protein